MRASGALRGRGTQQLAHTQVDCGAGRRGPPGVGIGKIPSAESGDSASYTLATVRTTVTNWQGAAAWQVGQCAQGLGQGQCT